jgi:tetratricopeptide (TPR) repeat protein
MMRRRCSPFTPTSVAAWLALTWAGFAPLRAEEAKLPALAATHAAAPALVPPDATVPVSTAETAPLSQAAAEPAPTAEAVATVAPKLESATPKAGAPVARKRATNEIHGLLNLGASLAERGDYGASEIAYRQILNATAPPEEDLKSALLGLAHMHRRKGELTKAAAIYERYLKDYPGDERTPEALLNLGRTLRGLGVYKMALARFYNVINSTLKLPGEGFDRYQVLAKTAKFEIAETHFQAGDFAEANKFYTRLRLLDLAPSDRARAHFKSGYALRLQGELEAAITTLRSYVEQWSDDENVPEARYLLAITLRELKRPQEAFAATLELLRTEKSRLAIDPKRWAYWQRKTGNQLANDFFETGDTMNARAIYAGLLDLSPEPAWRLPITYQLALCYERLGVPENARASYQAILDAVGANPPPDLLELATMAKWRIEHIAWRDRVGQQISAFFDSKGPSALATSHSPTAPLTTAATP